MVTKSGKGDNGKGGKGDNGIGKIEISWVNILLIVLSSCIINTVIY